MAHSREAATCLPQLSTRCCGPGQSGDSPGLPTGLAKANLMIGDQMCTDACCLSHGQQRPLACTERAGRHGAIGFCWEDSAPPRTQWSIPEVLGRAQAACTPAQYQGFCSVTCVSNYQKPEHVVDTTTRRKFSKCLSEEELAPRGDLGHPVQNQDPTKPQASSLTGLLGNRRELKTKRT